MYSAICLQFFFIIYKFTLLFKFIVDAFNSARSKFPRLDDILCNAGDPEQKAKLIEGKYIPYLFTFFQLFVYIKNYLFTFLFTQVTNLLLWKRLPKILAKLLVVIKKPSGHL